MAHDGARRRGSRGLALALLASTSACTALAGISGKEVDPCFDGCDGGVDTGADVTAPPPDGPLPQTGEGGGGDAGACPCPTGTQSINGICAVTANPAPNVQCASPLQLPDCPLKLALRVCDSDPAFSYDPACSGAGATSRPTAFLKLGTSPTGKFRTIIVGAFNVARPNVVCDQAGSPCIARDAGATGTSTFTSPGLPNGDVVAIGKMDGTGCSEIRVDVELAQ